MKTWLRRIVAVLLVILAVTLMWAYAPDTRPEAMRAKYALKASRFVDLGGGLKMHVVDEGPRDAPVLVLLHGSNASLHTWQPWVDRLADRYRVVRIDQIGHGLTGPNPRADYGAPAFVATLDAAMARIGVSRFALAGNSMGGWVAWNYALAHPGKVSALVLVDAGGPPDDPGKKLPIGFRIAQLPWLGDLTSILGPRALFEKSVNQTVANRAIVTPAMVDRYWELNRYPGNRAATRLRFAAWADRGKGSERLASLRVPTLVMWGENDTLIPASGAQWFADRIPGAKVIVYPGIGHLPMEEAADASARDLDAFLRGVSAPPAAPAPAPMPPAGRQSRP